MTPINILLGVISITGGLLLGVVLLAFVVASWINQPPISKQHSAQFLGEDTLASESDFVSNGTQEVEKYS
jgi:hypothetical protein